MDDLYALEGDGAGAWQRKHKRRKAREAAAKIRAQVRAEAKTDLAQRIKKWRKRWKLKALANKAAGLPPPSKKGRPRDIPAKRSGLVDMTGQRFGRLTVIRIAPVSRSKGQNRSWWVRCDCGSREHPVAGTNMRQGITKSCGCLKRGKRRVRPLSERMTVMAICLRSRGDKKAARLLELGAKSVSREEAALARGRDSVKLRKPRKVSQECPASPIPDTMH
jgi:hypothetical protein